LVLEVETDKNINICVWLQDGCCPQAQCCQGSAAILKLI